MNTDRRRILDLLAQGKITADEAEQLLGALSDTAGTASGGGTAAGASVTTAAVTVRAKARYLRVVVEGGDEQHPSRGRVNIRVPLSLLRAGVRLTSLIPDQARAKVQEAMNQKGISFDLANLKPEMLDDLIDQLSELTVDVDGEGNKVRVFCE